MIVAAAIAHIAKKGMHKSGKWGGKKASHKPKMKDKEDDEKEGKEKD